MFARTKQSLFAAVAMIATAASGCDTSVDEDPVGPPVDLEAQPAVARARVEARVLPAEESLTYRAYATRYSATGSEDVAVPTLRARVERADDRARLTIDVDGATTAVELDDGARVARDFAGEPVGGDLYDVLPPARFDVTLGASYANGDPSIEYVRANAEHGSITLHEYVTSTPVAMWSVGRATVVRVETSGMNRLYWNDGAGLGHQDIGLAYLGTADLLQVPDAGWRVLRMTRLSQSDSGKPADQLTLDDLRAMPHSEFVMCATSSTLVAPDLGRAGRTRSASVPEFARCTNR